MDAAHSLCVQQQGQASLAAIGEPPIRANKPPHPAGFFLVSGLRATSGFAPSPAITSILPYFSKYTHVRPGWVPIKYNHIRARNHIKLGDRECLLHDDNMVPCIMARERALNYTLKY